MRIALPMPQAHSPSGQRPARTWRWLALGAVISLIAAVVIWRMQASTTSTATTTATVSQDTLTINVSGSGSIAAARSVDLAMQQAGTITSVAVAVGDQVTAGQVLAQIDASSLNLALQQAQANLKAAEANLAQAKGGSATAQDLASAQAQLDSANAQLAQTKSGTATKADLTSAQAQLAVAKAQLDALKNPTAADRSTAQSKVEQAQLALQSTRDSASQAKTNSGLALQNAVNNLTQSQSKYATAKGNWDFVNETNQDPTNPETTDSTGKVTKNKLSDTQRQQYYDTFVQAQAALNSAENALTQAQVAYDAARQSEALQVAQAEAAIVDAQRNLDALLNPSASALIQAQASVTQVQASLDKLRQGGTESAITQAQASVTQAQANLEKLTAPSTDATIASAEASLLQAQVSVATAENNLRDATLVAPFDGVIAAVNIDVGSQISANTQAFTIIDRSKLHIDVSLSESDAADVQVGQPVALTFDALPDVTLNGTVTTIAPTATVSQNVVTYPVQIEFDPASAAVKIGMSATADIQIQQFTDAILVPSRAVQTQGTTKSVTVLQGPQGNPVVIPVTTGVTSNGKTVITSCVTTNTQCLKAGDLLSVTGSTGNNSSTTAAQSANSLVGIGGGGAPPSGPPPNP